MGFRDWLEKRRVKKEAKRALSIAEGDVQSGHYNGAITTVDNIINELGRVGIKEGEIYNTAVQRANYYREQRQKLRKKTA